MRISDLKKELRKKVIISNHIYITGHKDIDLDAFGAAVGISLLANKYKKKVSIIIDDKKMETGVLKAIETFKDKINIINSNSIVVDKLDKSLLIVVDNNKKTLIEFNKLLPKFTEIIVIDHHDINKDTIKNSILYVDSKASSACEITSELLKLTNVKISPEVATLLFSGIVLDTNNFILKATTKTFYISYYLMSLGASPTKVQYLLKQDLKRFIAREKMLVNVKIVNKKIAIAKGVKQEKYRREDLAKIADTLLLFNGIETSFVIGHFNDYEIGISGRTLGKLNVGKIMTELGGGGNKYEGATKIESKSVKEVEKRLISSIK